MCFKKGEKNILGTELVACSIEPITGFYRDGYCKAFSNDPGEHTVCAHLTNKFLMIQTIILLKAITEFFLYLFIGRALVFFLCFGKHNNNPNNFFIV